MASTDVYVLAARRSVVARIGGLHRQRRIEELSAPVVAAVFADARLEAKRAEAFILGNTSAGFNPARMVALSAGLPETIAALTVDRQSASALDAVLMAARMIATGEANIVIAGGAESPSTAPWRLGRPRGPHQLPHVLSVDAGSEGRGPSVARASDRLASSLGIGRAIQDLYVVKSADRAERARADRRFAGEIVAMRATIDEGRDYGPVIDIDDLQQQVAFDAEEGTATPGNTRSLADGAAFAVLASEAVWASLGKPPALRLVASAARGVTSDAEASALMIAAEALMAHARSGRTLSLDAVEIEEETAAQAIAFASALDLAEAVLNVDGGGIARGHPLGASGGVLLARLFTRLVRHGGNKAGGYGLAAQGAGQGLGVAALFERV